MTQGPQTQDLLLAQVGFNKQPTQDMDDVEEHVPTQGPLAMSPAAQVDQLQQLSRVGGHARRTVFHFSS